MSELLLDDFVGMLTDTDFHNRTHDAVDHAMRNPTGETANAYFYTWKESGNDPLQYSDVDYTANDRTFRYIDLGVRGNLGAYVVGRNSPYPLPEDLNNFITLCNNNHRYSIYGIAAPDPFDGIMEMTFFMRKSGRAPFNKEAAKEIFASGTPRQVAEGIAVAGINVYLNRGGYDERSGDEIALAQQEFFA